jgi:hypothetical protein
MGELARSNRTFASWIRLICGLLAVSIPASASPFAGGTGQRDDPYRIATAEQLIAIGQDPNLLDKHFALTNDLNLDPNAPGSKVFTRAIIAPYQDSTGDFKSIAFAGSLDGRGYKIRNLTIDGRQTGYLGLFGKTDKFAEIRNLSLVDICVSSSAFCIGGLVGHNGGTITDCRVTGGLSGGTGDWCSGLGLLAGENRGRISRCDVDGRITTALTKRGSRLGLLAGVSWGAIQNCTVRGTIMGGETFSNVGGLTGRNVGSITDSRAIANISMSSTRGSSGRFGGLVGTNEGSVSRCYAVGTISCGMCARAAGGLAGNNSGTILGCFASGDISGSLASGLGGLAGTNSGHIVHSFALSQTVGNSVIGGLVGSNEGSVSQCYSTGRVVAGRESWNPAGGLVATANDPVGGHTACSLWDTQASGMAASKGGTGLTSPQMTDAQTFVSAGWDFASERANGTTDLWRMPESGGPPTLAVFSKGYQRHELPGTGTREDPYRIATAEDLGAICLHDITACFKLVADVNLAGITWAVPVIPHFEGRFDGNGRTILNLSLRGDCFLGLFGVLGRDAVIEKLQIDEARIVAGDCAQGLGLLAVTNLGRITDCRVTGSITGPSKQRMHGDVVEENSGTITNCEPIADCGPRTTILTDPDAIRQYLKWAGEAWDGTWILESKDVDGLEETLRIRLEDDTPIPTRLGIDREYVLTHFRQYNRAYGGFIRSGTKYIICQMLLYHEILGLARHEGFAFILDGGCSIVTIVFNARTKAIVSVTCNGEA